MNSLKKLVNDKPLWDDFCAMLDQKIEAVHIRMEQATTADQLYRCQGETHALRRLKALRDEVNAKDKKI